MGTQKGKLFELAKMYRTYQNKDKQKKKPAIEKKPVRVKGEYFDEGKSISLNYSFDMYPEVLYDSHQRHAQPSQMSFFENGRSEAFYVEPFDAEETVDISYRESGEEDDDARLERIARGFGNKSEAIESMEEDVEKMKEMEEKLDSVFDSDDESSAMEAKVASEGRIDNEKRMDKSGAEDAKKDTEAVKMKEESKEEIKPYDASDEEFARDIGAILKGQKVYNAEHKKAVDQPTTGRSTESKEAPMKSGGKDDLLDPAKNEHKIFEKIAQSMTFANSYDLGSIALAEKFELMDQEIEKEEMNKILRDKGKKSIGDIEDVRIETETTTEESPSAAVSMEIGKFNSGAPLDNTNGGRLIKENSLQKGDFILASSSGSFDVIDGVLGSESIAGLYTGNNKLLTKGDGGALEEKALAPHMNGKGVMVVLRHQNISSEKASAIVDSLTKLRVGPEKGQAENWLKVNCPAINVHSEVCASDEVGDKKKCNSFAGKINLGTMGNDSFMCPESVINAFEKNQLGFVPLLSKEHNGSLKYYGHLKNKA